MKPIKITLQAIGSYLEKQSLDFSKYDNFFLISGDTGAGKTTIFDAMMFALYGSVAGTRKTSDIVNSFAGEGVTPFAEYEFLIHNERYSVYRSLPYQRKKKKGDGFTEDPETVVLKKKEGDGWKEVSGNKTDVDNEILEIIKFNKDEFSKLILLPQGEFQKFLVADTAEKRALLKNIFPIDFYSRFAGEINSKKNNYVGEQKRISKKIEELLEKLKPEEFEKQNNIYTVERKNLEKQKQKKQKELDAVKVLMSHAMSLTKKFEEYEKAKQESKKLEVALPEIEKNKTCIKEHEVFMKYRPSIEQQKNFKKIQIELNEKQNDILKQINVCEKELDKINKNYERIDEYRKVISDRESKKKGLEDVLDDFKESLKVKTENEILQKDLEEKKLLLDNLKNKLKNYDTQYKNKEEFKTSNINISEEIKKFNSKIHSYEKKLVDYYACQGNKDSSAIVKNKIAELKSQLAEENKKLDKVKKEFQEVQNALENNVLKKLAAEMNADDKCPLCGSKDHPLVYSSDSEKKDTRNSEEIFSKMNKTEKSVSIIQTKIETNENEIKKLKNLFSDDVNYVEEIKSLEKQKEHSSKELIEKEKTEIEYQTNEKDILDLNKKKNDTQNEYNKISEAVSKMKENVSSNELILNKVLVRLDGIKDPEKEIETLKKSISKGRTLIKETEQTFKLTNNKMVDLKSQKNSISTQISENKKFLEQLENEIENILKIEKIKTFEILMSFEMSDDKYKRVVKEIKEHGENMLRIKESLKHLQSDLHEKEKPNVEKIKKEIKSNEAEVAVIEKEIEKVNEKIINLKNIKHDYDKTYKEFKDVSHKLENIEKMARLVNGDNIKNMTFQDYVLAGYMQEVINNANKRLLKISNNQYILKRRINREKGQTKSGLEFNIIDLFDGCEREVQSLSGGEKFLTSLSLALGLSDVIQNRSGGRELEAIFIDEGFGSLDEQSLERAVSILDEIRGSKIVGIISHVKDLKTRIPSRINIKKTQSGSIIEKS